MTTYPNNYAKPATAFAANFIEKVIVWPDAYYRDKITGQWWWYCDSDKEWWAYEVGSHEEFILETDRINGDIIPI